MEDALPTPADDAPLPDATGLEDTLSPVDLPPPAEPLPHPLRWAATMIAVAALVLLPLNATAIRGWAYELEPNARTQPVIAAAERWYDASSGIGLSAPLDAMRGWWQRAQRWEFGGGGEEATPVAEEEPARPGFNLGET